MREITEKEVKLKQQLLESPAHQKVKGELQPLQSTKFTWLLVRKGCATPTTCPLFLLLLLWRRERVPCPPAGWLCGTSVAAARQLTALSLQRGVLYLTRAGGVGRYREAQEYGTYRALGVASGGQQARRAVPTVKGPWQGCHGPW